MKRQRTDSGYRTSSSSGGKRGYARYNYMLENKWNPMYGGNPEYYKRYLPRTQMSKNVYGSTWSTASADQKERRRLDRMYGQGRFSLSQLGKDITSGAKSLGIEKLRKAGANKLRDMAASAISGGGMYTGRSEGIRGRGSYSAPFTNDSKSMVLGSKFQQPHFQADGANHDDGGVVISNQEFVTDIYGNEGGDVFESRRFALQPADASLFPMLSQFAKNFERYELLQCVFHYETQLDAGIIQSSTGQVGDILLHHHMDSKEPEFASATEFLVNKGSIGRVTNGLACGVECDHGQLRGLSQAGYNYIREYPKDDLSDYDHGYMQIAVSGTPVDLANQVIGKLFVSYTVRLVRPRVHTSLGRGLGADTFALTQAKLWSGRISNGILFAQGSQTGDNHLKSIMCAPSKGRASKFNNLGCELISSTYGGNANQIWNKFGIKFPPNLMGYVRITMTMDYNTGGGAEGRFADPHPVESSSRWSKYATTGSVDVVEDIHNFLSINGDVTNGENKCSVKGHIDIMVRLSPPRGGIENRLFFSPYVDQDVFMAISPDEDSADPSSHFSGTSWKTLNDFWGVGQFKLTSSSDAGLPYRNRATLQISKVSDHELRGQTGLISSFNEKIVDEATDSVLKDEYFEDSVETVEDPIEFGDLTFQGPANTQGVVQEPWSSGGQTSGSNSV